MVRTFCYVVRVSNQKLVEQSVCLLILSYVVRATSILRWSLVPTNIYFYLQEEVHRYLRVTHSTLEIDFFNFEWYVHVFNHFTPERKFYKIDDISYGKENAPVSCVNSLDNNYPEYVRTHHMFSRILNFLFVIVFSREEKKI